ncbi:sodium/potassium-transporting ATPase subunit beta-2-like [Spea bombifrons]|uniref:sodium/potassium-transporting ATPase subunit beta-2-like n=1 Tax=Spea bombifrons TaxID=233779 RepID=UPI00234B12A0|nr:sodium/potassium-transporting ATPase subunit beta-2-like [Spea bombifrons]
MAALSQKRSCGQIMEEFREFMWNPRTREFMGRTGSSWGLILLFYLVFYAFLTAMFSLTMWVMLQTIDEYNPKYSDRLANPGLMIRPKTDGLDIVYNVTEGQASWGKYSSALDSVLGDYNLTVQEQRGSACNGGAYNRQEDTGDVRNYPKRACQFLRSSLGLCSGLEDNSYGYKDGTPCVLIKMNRVIHFLPSVIPQLSNTSITVNCTGKTEENERLLGKRVYFPNNGTGLGTIDLMYFPYYGNKAQKNYTQPLVAVRFENAMRNVDHLVECRVNAGNINNKDDRDKFAGRVAFRLRINN